MRLHGVEVLVRVLVRAEVGDEQGRRPPLPDELDALRPDLDVDVGRGRRGQHEELAAGPDAGDVADEGDAAVAVEEADVVGGVSRRVGDLELAIRRLDAFPAGEDPHVGLRHRQEGPPERVHLVAVQPRGAGQQFRRVDHVRRAPLVDVDRDVRVLAQQRAGGAGVIEMDVRQQQRAHVGDRDAGPGECRSQRFQARRRSRIDQGDPGGALNDGGRDDARPAAVHQVGVRDAARNRLHRGRIVLCRSRPRTDGPPGLAPDGARA